MKIALIGRGKLATNLLPALQHAGHDVVSVNSRTLEELPQTADAYIIAVKDSVLADVIRAVTKGREEQVFMHTAGSMPMSLFQGLAHHYGVFYPMQSFSKERTVYFAEIPTFIEANDDKTKQVIRQLAESVTQHVIELSSDDRQYLHLAAVFACNFVNHCYALAAEILEQHGMDFNVMLPLIDETARKVHQLHPLQAQTGPAMRYDENVIRHQLELLNDNPAAREIYERMSMNIHRKVTEK
ncbi:MAG: DUF2520 domain-containing protein [Prevotella sp.]|jgi:predicted short-subunit dehydrogenase-like oxidoreductase (DUF2520 family)|nr:DUF2520 domain-containing protein [Prevotella sp.]